MNEEKSEGRRGKAKSAKAFVLHLLGNGSLNDFICPLIPVRMATVKKAENK